MDRHLSFFECVEINGGRGRSLTDSAFVRKHAAACDYCGEKLKRLKNPRSIPAAVHSYIENPGNETFGYFYMSRFDNEIHTVPAAFGLIIASSNPYVDLLTGIPVIRIMLTHDYGDLHAERDLVCGPGDGLFDNQVICLWSEMEVPLSSVDNASPCGAPGVDTWSLLKSYCCNTELADTGRRISGRSVTEESAEGLLRKRLLKDCLTLADDLYNRRDIRVRALDALAGRLPDDISLSDFDKQDSLADILYRIVSPSQEETEEAIDSVSTKTEFMHFAAFHDDKAFNSPLYRARCYATAGETRNKKRKAVIMCILDCEQYIRSGKRALYLQSGLSINNLSSL